jgi:hypothetical protein
MRSHAVVATIQPEVLASMMGKHFGHKVEVISEGTARTIRIPAGDFALVPSAGALEVEASAQDAAGLARVQEVCADHLRRFSREEALEIAWSAPDG